LNEHEGIEWAHRRTNIAQQGDAGFDDIGNWPQRLHCLGPYRSVIAGIGGIQHRERSLCLTQSKLPPSIRMPPIEVPWPPIYLVVECSTIAAPWSSGRQSTGAAVLSMIRGTPSSRPIFATSAIGNTMSLGLGSVSA